jgi:hypothetical protein
VPPTSSPRRSLTNECDSDSFRPKFCASPRAGWVAAVSLGFYSQMTTPGAVCLYAYATAWPASAKALASCAGVSNEEKLCL